jgi:hypothetical protein
LCYEEEEGTACDLICAPLQPDEDALLTDELAQIIGASLILPPAARVRGDDGNDTACTRTCTPTRPRTVSLAHASCHCMQLAMLCAHAHVHPWSIFSFSPCRLHPTEKVKTACTPLYVTPSLEPAGKNMYTGHESLSGISHVRALEQEARIRHAQKKHKWCRCRQAHLHCQRQNAERAPRSSILNIR